MAMKTELYVPDGHRELVGDGTWKSIIRPYIDGEDIVCRGVVATRWGGADDKGDGGVTASGLDTARHPEIRAVSLPFRSTSRGKPFAETLGSPLPHLPWHMDITVYSHLTQRSVTAPLEDIGPAKEAENGADLTNGLVRALALALASGEYLVDLRLHGAAHLVVG